MITDMSKSPKVSVCIPVYNGVNYLSRALDNILEQTYTDLEILIANDCSTDETLSVIESYAARDKRIVYWTNEKNLRLFGNYNRCMEKASGEYIKLFAHDDLLAPDCIEKMLKVLEEKPEIALVTSSKNWIDEDDKILETRARFKGNVHLRSADVIIGNLVCMNNWIGEPAATMFRRKDWGTGFDTEFYNWGDLDYWFRILQNGDLYILEEVLCNFRIHGAQSTSSALSGMYVPADMARIYRLWNRYVSMLGESEEHYFQRVAERVAMHTTFLEREKDLKFADVRAANPNRQDSFSFETVGDFRVSLFHAERRITSLMEELIATQNELEHRANECKELKAAIDVMEKSVSWKVTKPLRVVRSIAK